jgi:hypothetical protein
MKVRGQLHVPAALPPGNKLSVSITQNQKWAGRCRDESICPGCNPTAIPQYLPWVQPNCYSPISALGANQLLFPSLSAPSLVTTLTETSRLQSILIYSIQLKKGAIVEDTSLNT